MAKLEDDLNQLAQIDWDEAIDFAIRCAERAANATQAGDEEFTAIETARDYLDGNASAKDCLNAADDAKRVAEHYKGQKNAQFAACAWAAFHVVEAINLSTIEHIQDAVRFAGDAAISPRAERKWQHVELRKCLPPGAPGPRSRLSSLATRCAYSVERGLAIRFVRRS